MTTLSQALKASVSDGLANGSQAFEAQINAIIDGPGSASKRKINALVHGLSNDELVPFMSAMVNMVVGNGRVQGELFEKQLAKARRMAAQFCYRALSSHLLRLIDGHEETEAFAALLANTSSYDNGLRQLIVNHLSAHLMDITDELICRLVVSTFSHRVEREDWLTTALQTEKGCDLVVNMLLWARRIGLEIQGIDLVSLGKKLTFGECQELTSVQADQCKGRNPEDHPECVISVILNIKQRKELEEVLARVQAMWAKQVHHLHELNVFADQLSEEHFMRRWQALVPRIRTAINDGRGDLVKIDWSPLRDIGLPALWIIREPETIEPPGMLVEVCLDLWGRQGVLLADLNEGRLTVQGLDESEGVKTALRWIVLDAYERLTTLEPKETARDRGQVVTGCSGSGQQVVDKIKVQGRTRRHPSMGLGWEPSVLVLKRRQARYDEVADEALSVLGRPLDMDEVWVQSHLKSTPTNRDSNKAAITIKEPEDPSCF